MRRWSITWETEVSCVATIEASAETWTSCVTAPSLSKMFTSTFCPTCRMIPLWMYLVKEGAETSMEYVPTGRPGSR